MSKLDSAAWPGRPVNNNASPRAFGMAVLFHHGWRCCHYCICLQCEHSSRGPSALDSKDITANAPVFTPSPLLPQDGSAWSIARPASLHWAKDLFTRPTPASDILPIQPPQVLALSEHRLRQPRQVQLLPRARMLRLRPPSNTKTKSAAPIPKRAPIRSAPLIPAISLARGPSPTIPTIQFHQDSPLELTRTRSSLVNSIHLPFPPMTPQPRTLQRLSSMDWLTRAIARHRLSWLRGITHIVLLDPFLHHLSALVRPSCTLRITFLAVGLVHLMDILTATLVSHT